MRRSTRCAAHGVVVPLPETARDVVRVLSDALDLAQPPPHPPAGPDATIPLLIDVTDVSVLGRYIVELTFDTGEVRVIDMEGRLTGPMFADLMADYDLFCAVTADPAAGTIVWPDGADNSPSGLYFASRPSVPT